MTTIKFRRDTSANWTAKNPIPAQGEPCYETDTGKLKIGNGSDSYTTLPYISDGGAANLPIASTTTLGAIKVGNNLTIAADGTLSATGGTTGTTDYTQLENKPQINSVELTGNKTLNDLGIQPKGNYLTALPDNAVTTDTEQAITGKKTLPLSTNIGGITFGVVSDTWGGRYLNIPHNWGISKLSMNENSLKYSDHQNKTIINAYTTNSLGTVWEQNTSSFTTFNTSTLGAGNGLKLYADSTGKAALSCPNGGYTFLRSKDIDNNTIKMVNGVLTANVSTDLPVATTETLGGIKVGNNLSITEDGTLSATGGSTPTNMVTTDTNQTISESKTFAKSITTASIYPTDEITFNSTSQNRYINNIDSIAGGYHSQDGYLTFKGDTTLVGDNKLVLDGRSGGLKLTAASSANITCENTLIAPNIVTTANGTIKLTHPANVASGIITLNNNYGQLSISSSSEGNNNLLGVTRGTTYALIDGDGITTKDKDGNLHYYINSQNIDTTYMKWDDTSKKLTVDTAAIADTLRKQDKSFHVIETYVNGTSGYRIWSDGYCEQWGVANYPKIPSRTSKITTITLLKKFANVNYSVSHNIITDGGNTEGLRNHCTTLQVETLQFGWYSTNSTAASGTFCWRASGYLASGQY